MNLILVRADEAEDDETYILSATDVRAVHVKERLCKSRVRVGVVGGVIGEALVVVDSDVVRLSLDVSTLRWPAARPSIRVVVGLPFPKVVKSFWSVFAAFGVEAIFYAPATLSNADFAKTSALDEKIYTPLLLEGLAQAEDTRLPSVQIFKTKTITDLLADDFFSDDDNYCKLLLHLGDFPSIRTCLRDWYRQCEKPGILLAIGPERGWTNAEATAFQSAGFIPASLGDPILRTDTAAIAALALARDALTDLPS